MSLFLQKLSHRTAPLLQTDSDERCLAPGQGGPRSGAGLLSVRLRGPLWEQTAVCRLPLESLVRISVGPAPGLASHGA